MSTTNPPEVLPEPASSDTARLQEFEAGVAAVLPVIPVVCRQLSESAEHVERSVVGVCADFQSIADRARGSVDRAAKCLGQSAHGGQGIGQLTEAARDTITRLLQRAEESHTRLIETAGKVEAVEREMRRIEELARKVDGVSASIKILSINARIEAARAGAAGRAFAVVAGETGKVSADAAEMNQAIQEVTHRLTREVRAIAGEIRAQVTGGRAQVEATRTEVGETFGQLTVASGELHQAVEAAARDAADVAQAIGRAVIALQFQDAVSQRVGNAVAALREVEADLARFLQDGPAAEIGDHWAGRLSGLYTMASEHDVLRGQSGPAASNIELF